MQPPSSALSSTSAAALVATGTTSPTAWPTQQRFKPKEPGQRLGIGLIGLGTVGQGVYKLLKRHPQLDVRHVVVRNPDKPRFVNGLGPNDLSGNPAALLADPNVAIVIEVAGGVVPAKHWIEEALKAGKHVVTANKELLAKHGPELFALANKHNVRLLMEGAVAGGIPILLPLRQSLAANHVEEIAGILNGTTNYILTRMMETGASFADALAEAQAKGFAEADPTSDVEGYDAAYKTAILAMLTTERSIAVNRIHCEGITKVSAADMAFAKAQGYAIRLIGLARFGAEPALPTDPCTIDLRVHPMLVANTHPLASIRNENNAIVVKGDALGQAMFYGKGAGELPTASSVMGDVLALVADCVLDNDPVPSMRLHCDQPAQLLPIGDTSNRYYLRLITEDAPGVIGQLGTAFGQQGVSVASLVQAPDTQEGRASLVIVTHHVREAALMAALELIKAQPTTHAVASMLRVLD
jgi:homoserine dehydrogenase